jgi:hypothetical protein
VRERIYVKKKVLLVANIIVPLLLGALFYVIVAPDVIFVNVLGSLIGSNSAIISQPETFLDYFVRYYMMDMLWGYSLVFALFFCFGNNAAVKKAFIIAFIFSTAMELVQLTSFVPGTFDVWDIVMEGVAEVIAAFIIKTHFYEEATNICETKQNG